MAAFLRQPARDCSYPLHALRGELPTGAPASPPSSQGACDKASSLGFSGIPSQAALSDAADQDPKFHHCELVDPSPTASPVYSLTYGPLSSSSSSRSPTSTDHLLLGSASSSSSSFPDTSPFSPAQSLHMSDEPHIHPSDRMKSLLSKLACEITALKMAFSVMRASSVPLASAKSSFSRTEKAILSELQTLANLQIRLHSLVLQHDFGVKEVRSFDASASEAVGTDEERKDSMLKRYEDIISRFHDEIRQKDATVEALKQTLAKSMLRGEKLEGRIKALEAKALSLL